jgi:hypothetical protein
MGGAGMLSKAQQVLQLVIKSCKPEQLSPWQ